MEQQETKKFVAYLRRSKKEQTSALGLEAQNIEVNNYVKSQDGVLINTWTEIESGTNDKLKKRTVIWDAIKNAQENDATLVIAKLDRLARDVEFTSRMMNSKVRFVACDVPMANEFTIHIMAAVAQQEAKRISERTKAALQRKKDRGEPLGYWSHKKRFCHLDVEAREKAIDKIKHKSNTNPNNTRAKNYAKELYRMGVPYEQIMARMNNEGFASPTGKKIHRNTVVRWVAQP
jgi:DNA invertase Pin-like site-specific DNA recombinase